MWHPERAQSSKGRGGVSTWSTTTGRLLTVLVESPSWYLNSFVGVAAFRNGVAGFSLNGVLVCVGAADLACLSSSRASERRRHRSM